MPPATSLHHVCKDVSGQKNLRSYVYIAEADRCPFFLSAFRKRNSLQVQTEEGGSPVAPPLVLAKCFSSGVLSRPATFIDLSTTAKLDDSSPEGRNRLSCPGTTNISNPHAVTCAPTVEPREYIRVHACVRAPPTYMRKTCNFVIGRERHSSESCLHA